MSGPSLRTSTSIGSQPPTLPRPSKPARTVICAPEPAEEPDEEGVWSAGAAVAGACANCSRLPTRSTTSSNLMCAIRVPTSERTRDDEPRQPAQTTALYQRHLPGPAVPIRRAAGHLSTARAVDAMHPVYPGHDCHVQHFVDCQAGRAGSREGWACRLLLAWS